MLRIAAIPASDAKELQYRGQMKHIENRRLEAMVG
jgi:hypothetical protein